MNLNVMCNINQLSYGVVPFYFLKYLHKADIKCSLFPINNLDISAYEDQDCSFLNKFLENGKNFDKDAPTLRIYHQFALAESIGSGKRIGWSFYELDQLNQNEVLHINSLDCFIVSSGWAKEVAEKSGVTTKIEIIRPSCEKLLNRGYSEDKTVRFMCVGKFEIRKCHDLIIKAFGNVFSPFDNVLLDLYTHNPFNSEEENAHWLRLIKSSSMSHKTKVREPIKLHSEVLSNYSNYDCLIGLSRAEGFNLPLFEAMNAGLLCIANDNSAMEYVDKSNCVYVPTSEKITAIDNKWFHGDGSWADFNLKDIEEGIKKAYDLIVSNKQDQIVFNSVNSVKGITWEKSVEKLIKVVEKI